MRSWIRGIGLAVAEELGALAVFLCGDEVVFITAVAGGLAPTH